MHDVFIRGLTPQGVVETSPSWHTILFVPFGRGGSGFTVLDVTNPIVEPAAGPLHMFTVYNDYINNVVHIADHDGDITSYEYASGQASLTQSEEGQIALNNYNQAREDDGEDTLWTQDTIDDAIADGTFTDETAPQVGDIQIPAPTTNRDNRSSCQGPDPADGNIDNFIVDGTNSCYTGRTFTFRDIQLNTAEGQDIDKNLLNVTELVDGTFERIDFDSARMQNNELVITFNTSKTIDRGDSSTVDAAGNVTTSQSDNIFIQTSCTATTIADAQYDYSKLGETWSTPRIVRLPSDIAGEQDEPLNDKYVAIMGGGMSTANACTGSALFLVDLSDTANPGRLYGSSTNGGPITIVDTHPTGFAFGNSGITTANGSEINNAVPTTPVVITPDTAFGIPWRGAMVYINDREGKITKINLTDSTANGAALFNQKTLFRLNANTTNRRYSFFGMDAGIGNTTKDFWLFGGTGDFNALGDKTIGMDNILYGIRDREYPFFVPSQVPLQSSDTFVSAAHADADAAKSIDDATHCSDVSLDDTGDACPDTEDAWVYHLDPITLSKDETVDDALNCMREYSIGGIPIVDKHGKLIGIVTNRDLRFEKNMKKKICDVMTSDNIITGTKELTLKEAEIILQKSKIEKLPIVDKENKLIGLITFRDIQKITLKPSSNKDEYGRLRVAAAIGVGGDPIIGTTLLDSVQLFMEDEETDVIVLIGEIGGQLEIDAAKWIKNNGNQKPVVGFIAGETAPKGRKMGHAGAIIGGKDDTATAKKRIMRESGISVVDSPADIGKTVKQILN